MIVVNAKKAEPTGSQVIEDVQINLVEGPPVKIKDLDLPELRKFHQAEASAIFRALRSSLPGGVFDQLLGLMLADKASYLVVRHMD